MKFTAHGDFLVSLGGQGAEPGRFEHPTDVAVDEEDKLYVVDFGNRRLQVFAPRPTTGSEPAG